MEEKKYREKEIKIVFVLVFSKEEERDIYRHRSLMQQKKNLTIETNLEISNL